MRREQGEGGADRCLGLIQAPFASQIARERPAQQGLKQVVGLTQCFPRDAAVAWAAGHRRGVGDGGVAGAATMAVLPCRSVI